MPWVTKPACCVRRDYLSFPCTPETTSLILLTDGKPSPAFSRLRVPSRHRNDRRFPHAGVLPAGVIEPAHPLGEASCKGLGVLAQEGRWVQLGSTWVGKPPEFVSGNADDSLGGGGSFGVCLFQECCSHRLFPGVRLGLLLLPTKYQLAGLCVPDVSVSGPHQASLAGVTARRSADPLAYRSDFGDRSLGYP